MKADTSHRFGVLIAAHGSRGTYADNGPVMRLAERVAARIAKAPVRVGLIKGAPTINAAIKDLDAQNIVVYPLFLSGGFFGRTVISRLVQEAIEERPNCVVTALPPLGLDPAFADLLVSKAACAAETHSFPVQEVALVLLAHGSRLDQASADAAEVIAARARASRRFQDVRVAFLEQPPTFQDTLSKVPGPVIVAGLFTGGGLHGADDVKRLMAGLNRQDAILLQNAGEFANLDELVAAKVGSALAGLAGTRL